MTTHGEWLEAMDAINDRLASEPITKELLAEAVDLVKQGPLLFRKMEEESPAASAGRER